MAVAKNNKEVSSSYTGVVQEPTCPDLFPGKNRSYSIFSLELNAPAARYWSTKLTWFLFSKRKALRCLGVQKVESLLHEAAGRVL